TSKRNSRVSGLKTSAMPATRAGPPLHAETLTSNTVSRPPQHDGGGRKNNGQIQTVNVDAHQLATAAADLSLWGSRLPRAGRGRGRQAVRPSRCEGDRAVAAEPVQALRARRNHR